MSRPSTGTRGSSADVALTFGVLGPLEVRRGSSLLDVPGPQERALLALLLTAPGRVFSVSAIVAGMWGEKPPAGAAKTVQSYVSRLRGALPVPGASLVLTRRPGYVAAVSATQVDAEQFRVLAANGRRDLDARRPGSAAAELRAALGLWRGEAYAEFDAPFAAAERTALEELRLAVVEDRIAADLAMNASQELVGELETLVGRHPWRERLWAQLMTALYRSGRQGDALGAFQRARRSLVDELGIEPGPELRAVEAMVLAQDVALLGVDRSPVSPPSALTVVGPMFVGRDAELAQLLEAYDRAAAGSVERLLVTGRHGIGKTSLLAEFARQAQARGGLVRYGAGGAWPRGVDGPVVIILDDLQEASPGKLTALAERVVAAGPPLLLVGACVVGGGTAEQTAALLRIFPDRLPVPPLQPPEIAEIVRLYVPAEAVGDAAASIVDGAPLQVHAAASRYGEELAAAQVADAAAGISGPRRHLTAAQERVADGVLDLRRVRLARAVHDPVAPAKVICPYKGLAFFEVDDAPFFFGREGLVARLVARLVDARLLAVVGGSGSGKSSVVRAGLVAAVRAGVLPGSERWCTLLTTPTQPPPDLPSTGTRTVLVVDQFEELFTALSPTQREGYADWLAGAAVDDKVTVVVVVRSDYYAQAAASRRVRDLLAADTMLVGEMTSDELRHAVELPAAAAGLELELGLADALAGDVAGQSGGLPLLSTALLSLWERRDGRRITLAAYHAMGGVRSAVARLAEAAYAQLTPNQQSVARRTLLRLAETGEGGEPVRRRAPIAEVAPEGDADARAALDTLAARRLLTISETHAEVAHEALLREWPRLRGWLDEDEAGRKLRRHLGPAAREWQAGGRHASELYRGPRLAAALDWQRDHPDDLTALEHDFLRKGREAAEAEALRRRRSIRRLRSLAVGLTGGLLLAVVAGLVALDQRNDAAESSFAADVRSLQAKALDEVRWDRALLYAAQAQRFDASPESRAALLQTLQRGPEATAILAADQPLHSLATSADGTMLVAGGRNGSMYVWDTAEGRGREIPDVTAFWPAPLDVSPDGRYVATVGVPMPLYVEKRFVFHVVVVDLEQTPPAVRFLESAPADAARFAADGRTIVTVDGDGRIRYVDVATGLVQRSFDVEVASPGSVVLDGPGNRRFLAASWQQAPGQVVAWEVDSGRQVWSSVEPSGAVAGISPDGSALVIGHADGRIDLIDVASGSRTPVASSLAQGLVSVVWAPDGATFAGVTTERTVLVWDAETTNAQAILRGHWGNVSEATYSPDGETLYAAGFDRAVLAWDLTGTRGIVKDVLARPGSDVVTALFQSPIAALAPDASVAATAHPGRRLVLTDTATAESFDVSLPGEGEIIWVYIDRLGRTALASVGPAEWTEAGARWTWHAIDLRQREVLPYIIETNIEIGGDAIVTWDNDAVLAAGEQQVGLWDLATGTPMAGSLFQAAHAVSAMGAHPGGRIAALSEADAIIEIIDVTTGELVATLDAGAALGERLAIGPVAFSPDGRWLAGATGSGDVVVWDTRTWQQHSTWEASLGAGVRSLMFTPDSDFIVAGGTGAAALWSVEGASGGVRLDVDPIQPEAQAVVGIKDDGRAIVTFTAGTGVREWTIEPGRLLERACAVAGRNLTRAEWNDVLPGRPYERTCPQFPSG